MKAVTKKQPPGTIEKAMVKISLPQHLQDLNEWINGRRVKSAPLLNHEKKGNVVLFYGSKKSGKHTIATMLASHAGKELYRVDLSKLVSKYIGETEKNISALFKLAEAKDHILFFDEADALFGKRSEVKDAHDKYANLEVSYLIQKIEAYNGLVILSATRRSNIDKAFQRKLQFAIHSPSA